MKGIALMSANFLRQRRWPVLLFFVWILLTAALAGDFGRGRRGIDPESYRHDHCLAYLHHERPRKSKLHLQPDWDCNIDDKSTLGYSESPPKQQYSWWKSLRRNLLPDQFPLPVSGPSVSTPAV